MARARKFFILLFFLVIGFTESIAQSQSTINWYFGNNGYSLRFVRPKYKAKSITIPINIGPGMSAVGTNPVSGDVMFYTNGINVYDTYDVLMPTGNGLNGSSAVNQTVAITAVPGQPDQYYIFSNNGNITYSIVDMTVQGNAGPAPEYPRGDVTTKNLSIPGIAGSYDEGMLALPKDTRDGFWLILHQTGGAYTVVDISAGGFSVATSAIAGAPGNVSNFSYNKNRGLLAIAPQDAGEEVATVPFSTGTGTPGTPVNLITGTGPSTQTTNIYDTEWSNNGRYLYISGNNGAAQDVLLQADLDTVPMTLLPVGTQNMQRSLGLQMAPDSMIYHLYQHTDGTFRLGRINTPDTTASQVLYTGAALGTRNYQGHQLPAFLPPFDPMIMVDFTYSGTCANVPTTFLPAITPDADSVLWNFGDGSGSKDLAPFYTYEDGGAYTVNLTVYLNGESKTVSKPVNITQFDLQISGFPESDTVCAEDFAVSYTAEAGGGQGGQGGGGGANPIFRWSNQDFDDATTSIDSAGNYYVTATDQSTGCIAYGPLRVVEYGAIEQRAFIWYFGQHAGIDFNPIVDQDNPGPAVPIPFGDPSIYNNGNQMTAPEGCSIYCDNNGNPLFYTDGEEMYDREGNQIAANLGGDQESAQSVLIQEFPNDATLYYVFLTRRIYDPTGMNSYQLSYVVFDLKLNNGLGGLMTDQLGNLAITDLFNPNTERITGNGKWVITHQYGNRNFRVYPVTGAGIGAPVISNVGSVHPSSSATAGQGYMRLSAANKLAVALSISENYVELFNFEDSTGAVTDPVKLDFGSENGQVYGVEYSPDGRMLYATVRNPGGGGPSKIYRWQVDTTTVAGQITDPTYIIGSRDLVVNESGVDLGAMQLGPDGQIYIARNGSPNLAALTNPGAVLNITPQPDPGYVLDGFGLGSDLVNGGNTLSLLGLPNFSKQFSTSPPDAGVNVFNGCSGEDLNFTITNPETLETYRWTIFDSDSVVVDTGIGEDFTFNSDIAGTYTARVDIIPLCEIVDNPPTPVTAEFMVTELPQLATSNVVNTSACQDTDGSFDLTIQSPGSFAYELSGPVSMISDTIPGGGALYPITGLPAGTYNVYVINTGTGCQNAISQVINDSGVEFTLTADTQLAACDSTGGSIQINIVKNDPAVVIGYPIDYVIRGQDNNKVYTGAYDGVDGLDQFTHSPVRAGTYNVEVSENGGAGCTVTSTDITVGTPPFATLDLPSEVVICDNSPADIPFTTDAPAIRVLDPVPGEYEIFADQGIIRVTVPGTYIIQTEDISGDVCPTIAETEVIYTEPAKLPDDFPTSFSICPQDPIEENTYAVIDPGPGIASVQYLDAEGGLITGSGPDYSVDGNVLTAYVEGPISVQLTNAYGCDSEQRVDIIEDCQSRINAPDALRPNSPVGMNATWRIFPFLVSGENFQVFIFNRWGEMIFQSRDINFTWNGGYDNDPSRPVTPGTYAYKIEYQSSFDDGKGLQEVRGKIVLIR